MSVDWDVAEDQDDASLLSGNAPVDLEDLGTIELQGWRVISGERHDWNRNHFDQREIGAVNERSKKAASHVVGCVPYVLSSLGYLIRLVKAW